MTEGVDYHYITPRIILGNDNAARKAPLLGVTHVVNAASELPNYHESKIRYLRLGLHDKDDDILKVMEPAYRYMNAVLKSPKTKILVHCYAGISRSASTVIYYLMRSQGMSYSKARALVKGKRKIIQPNEHYHSQLEFMDGVLSKL